MLETRGKPLRATFVMEQTLGHVTHYRNLRASLAKQAAVETTWLPIPFAMSRAERLVPLYGSNWSVRASWRARRALRDVLRVQAPDVVVFHTQVSALFALPVLRAVPAVVSLDATPLNYDRVGAAYGHAAAAGGILDRQAYQLNRRVFHGARALVTWSDWARRSLHDDYGVNPALVRVIAPGAAATYFDIGKRRFSAPRQASERVRVLFVGGDFARKGGPLLLESFRGALGGRCELHLVTRDPVPATPNVHVYRDLGPNSPLLRRLFAEADLFVLPSHGDCLAMVLMEATAAALPVVCTRVGALDEAVQHGVTGLLVPPGDGRALQQAMLALVADSPRRRAMGRAGHALARQKFDARRNAMALLALLQQVAGRQWAEEVAA